MQGGLHSEEVQMGFDEGTQHLLLQRKDPWEGSAGPSACCVSLTA